MKEHRGWTNYEERLGRVTAYIRDHLDEELDLKRLAEVACLSLHHWHLIYHAIHGETIAGLEAERDCARSQSLLLRAMSRLDRLQTNPTS